MMCTVYCFRVNFRSTVSEWLLEIAYKFLIATITTSMLLRGIVRHVNQIRFYIAHILDDCLSKWQLPPGLQLMPSAASPRSGDCLDIYGTDRSTTSSFDPSSIISDFLWFAAPKSKV